MPADTLVLCYHAVSERWDADLSLPPQALREQLGALSAKGYRAVTFTEAATTKPRGKRVAVTFDDAFASVVTLAKPILDELGWVATVFAVSDFAAKGTPLRWPGVEHWADTEHAAELASLDWEALRELQGAGWEIGSHTATHPKLTQVDDDTLRAELTQSREAVAAALGSCASIAYPYGDVDARVVEAARQAGYAAAAALPARWHAAEPHEHPRVGVYHPDDHRRFRIKTSRATRAIRGAVGR